MAEECDASDYDGCIGGYYKVAIPPTAPGCVCGDDHHVWREVRLHGKGDGLVRTEVCDRDGCNVARTTDTWATRPYDGKQGCAEVRYHRPDGSPFPGAEP